jgi:hypothetical protein
MDSQPARCWQALKLWARSQGAPALQPSERGAPGLQCLGCAASMPASAGQGKSLWQSCKQGLGHVALRLHMLLGQWPWLPNPLHLGDGCAQGSKAQQAFPCWRWPCGSGHTLWMLCVLQPASWRAD